MVFGRRPVADPLVHVPKGSAIGEAVSNRSCMKYTGHDHDLGTVIGFYTKLHAAVDLAVRGNSES